MPLWTKYALTSALIVLISELAKRSDRLGGLIAAMPIMTLLTLCLLYMDHNPSQKIALHAYYTFWYVVPTLPFFLIFPYCLPRLGFWTSLGLSSLITALIFYLFMLLMRQFNIFL